MMRSAQQIQHVPVVDTKTGEILGHVLRVIMEPDRKRVAGFLIERDRFVGRYAFVAFNQTDTVGEHALFLTKDQFQKSKRDSAVQPKLRAFDCDGYEVGTVQDIWFHEKNGNVERLEISGGIWGDFRKGRFYADRFAKMEFSEDLIVWPAAIKGMLTAETKKRGDEA